MSLSDLFEIPDTLTPGQARWLATCSAIPGLKATCGDQPCVADIELARDAQSTLASRPTATNSH